MTLRTRGLVLLFLLGKGPAAMPAGVAAPDEVMQYFDGLSGKPVSAMTLALRHLGPADSAEGCGIVFVADDVNLEAARGEGMNISSRLLRLAHKVYGLDTEDEPADKNAQ